MLDRRRFKLIMFLALAALLLFCCLFFYGMESAAVRPVGRISPQQLEGMEPDVLTELSMLRFKSQSVATDIYSETVYISADPGSSDPFAGLSCLDPGIRLYIVTDEYTNDIPAAVSKAHTFRLALVKAERYRLVNLVLSPFPVINLSVTSSYIDDRGNAAYRGDFTMASGSEAQAVSSAAQWNVRGNTSSSREKKSWHLELQKLSGKDMEHELLDLGRDSDWILNPMVFDDLKLREKLAMDFWNSFIYPHQQANKMSSGRYVELVFDGEYFGLYLLQKRIDAEHLGLDKSRDLLFKSSRTDAPMSLQENYELVFSPLGIDESYDVLASLFDSPDGTELDSLLLTNSFIDLLSSADNTQYKNMIYVLRYENGERRIAYLPWDTDLSLGMLWSDERGIDYLPDTAMDRVLQHRELTAQIDSAALSQQDVARYWQRMREDIYTEENFFSVLDSISAELSASGALIRDEQRWGLSQKGEDDLPALRRFISERLEYLDTYYSTILTQ